MEQYVIIEKLKEAIGDRRVEAAVFYTFSFDARFFENYLLTTFLPYVPFSDNEIQNTILWRKYVTELPPVTVYCDFQAKSPQAPALNYQIRTIDMPSQGGRKACFHPKVSFILLSDGTLITITGSNNLTEGGWCTNKEIVSFIELKSGVNFPYELKSQLWNFLKETKALSALNDFSEAETRMDHFFRQRLYTDGAAFDFYCSYKVPFKKLLAQLLATENETCFKHVEVISPYITTGSHLIDEMLSLAEDNTCHINVPYKALNEADITESNYRLFREKGVKWSRLLLEDAGKNFRFNHSKIYRLKTSKTLYTIIGSVNFTNSAWDSRNNANGNVETAMIYREAAGDWQPWLQEFHNKDLVFVSEQGNEATVDERSDAPDFNFILDWQKKTLSYKNPDCFNFSGKISFNQRNFELKTGIQTVLLDDAMLNELADNTIIKVWQYHVKNELIYYPIQVGFESKPLPVKLRLKDGELIQLWDNVTMDKTNKSEIADLIEKFIMKRQNADGDIVTDEESNESTINMMASHISALIRIEERIFYKPQKKGDYAQAKELSDYYLFVTNIDTLSGYRKLLDEMFEKGKLLAGTYWFLLNMLLKDFYDKKKIKAHYKYLNASTEKISDSVDVIREEINSCAGVLEKQMKNKGLNSNLLKWVAETL
jgi:hypothetical protein